MANIFKALLSAFGLMLMASSCGVLSEAGETDICDSSEIGEQDGPVIGAYKVSDGEVQELCFGKGDPRLLTAWEIVGEFTTEAEREPVAVLAGFQSRSAPNRSGNVAFAGPLSTDPSSFVIAVELEEAMADLDELRVTMAHEFAHVFTQAPDQFSETSEEYCDTFWNGTACFKADSYIGQWVAEFWSSEQLGALPASGETDDAGAENRCSINPGFLGAYSASHPEEDFAETFGAYVYGIDVPDAISPKLEFLDRFEEFQAYRERAAQSFGQDLPNNFDRCG